MDRRAWYLSAIIIVLILIWRSPVAMHAAEFGEGCPKALTLLDQSEWNKAETCVWDKIIAGKRVDFGTLDLPCDSAETMKRSLRPSFLKKILLDESYSKLIPHFGARIRGAFFTETLDFENADLKNQLVLEHCYFEKSVNFNGVKSKYGISLAESTVKGSVLFSGATIEGYLNLNSGNFQNLTGENLKVNGPMTIKGATITSKDPEKPAIELTAAKIGGQLNLDHTKVFGAIHMPGVNVGSQLSAENCKIRGRLNMSGAMVEHQLTLKQSEIDEIQMPGIKIKSRLVLNGATVVGSINLNAMQAEGNIDLVQGNFSSLSLITANVRGSLDMQKSRFSGRVETYGLSVGDVLDLKEAQFEDELRMQRSLIGSILYLNSAKFLSNVSLKGATINGDLYTDSAEFRGKLDMGRIRLSGELIIKEATFEDDVLINLAQLGIINYKGVKKLQNLDLTGTNVDKMMVVVKDTSDFPENLQLHGFTYNFFMGEYGGRVEQEQEFFQAWLKKLAKYTPQPYTQCAKVLREFGLPERANDVLFAGKEEERKVAWRQNDFGRWLWLSALKWTIGYGFGMKYFQSLFWVFLLIVVGTLVCNSIKDEADMKPLYVKPAKDRWANYFFYSMDILLPIISLRDLHAKIDPPGWPRLYFYFHKIAGWLLAFFILAGLAGITQK